MKANEKIYNPTHLQKNVLLMFFIGDIGWLEYTPGGKNTSDYLQMSIF